MCVPFILKISTLYFACFGYSVLKYLHSYIFNDFFLYEIGTKELSFILNCNRLKHIVFVIKNANITYIIKNSKQLIIVYCKTYIIYFIITNY